MSVTQLDNTDVSRSLLDNLEPLLQLRMLG